jgi:hypothetical protein
MDARIKRGAVSLCLLAAMATPVWAAEVGPGNGALVLTSPGKAAQGPSQQAERGTITRVEAGDHPRVLLAGDRMANGEQRLTWASITSSTRITVREGEQTRAGSVADLQVGPQVEVTWAGPLMLSYPAQGTAAEIVIHK